MIGSLLAGLRWRRRRPRKVASARRPADWRTPAASLLRAPAIGLLLAQVVGLLVAPPAIAASQVHDLDFVGAEVVPERVLRKSILTRGPDRWRFWRPRPEWSEGALEEDLDRIEQTYRSYGYYSAVARYEIVEREDGRSVDIVIRIDEGEPVRLAAIELELGEGSPISAEKLIPQLPLQVGDVFAVDRYRESRARVLAELANRGHPAARIEGGAEVAVERRAAIIRWRVPIGPPVSFGELRVEGLDRIDEKIVRREIAVKEGETYSAEVLDHARTRLLRLQLFRYVSVQPDKLAGAGEVAPAPAPDAEAASEEADEEGPAPAGEAPPAAGPDPTAGAPTAAEPAPTAEASSAEDGGAPASATTQVWPVVVQLQERPPRSISLGAGWATGLGPRGSARWMHRNFLGGARRFAASGSGSPLEQSAYVQLLQPYVFGTGATLTAESGWRRRHRDSYDNNNVDFSIGPRRSLSESWVLEGFYRFGWTDVRNVTDTTNEVLREQRGSGLLSGVGVRARRIDIDRPTDPRRGTWLQLGLATNLRALGSDFDWMRYDGEARAYLPLGPTVAAFRARYQAIQPMGSTSADRVPLGERLFLGGPNMGRGFPFEELGPLDDDGEPVGGVSSLLLSAEWRIPVWGPFTTVGFVDVGQVSLEPFGFSDVGIGTGAGLAISTPIGPIALYVAYPVKPLETAQRVRVAISIGHAF